MQKIKKLREVPLQANGAQIVLFARTFYVTLFCDVEDYDNLI